MFKLKLKQLKNTLINLYDLKIPAIYYGGYGIGKTEIEREAAKVLAKSQGRTYIEWNELSENQKQRVEEEPQKYFVNLALHVGQFDSVDLHGLPKLNGDDYTVWRPIRAIRLFSKPEIKGILFLDEYPQSREDVQKASTQLIRDKQMGDIPLADGVYVCAAGNREEDNSGVIPLLEHVKDRFVEFELRFDKRYYIGDDKSDGFFADRLVTPLYIFLKYDPSWLYKVDNARQDKASTPRGIMERANELLEKNIDNKDKWYDLIAMSVGEGFASSFMAWYDIRGKLNVDEIMNDPTKAQNITEPAALFSLVSVLYEKYKDDYDIFNKVISIAKEIDEATSGAYVMTLLKQMKNLNPTGFRKVLRHPAWKAGLAKTYAQFIDIDKAVA